MYRLTVLYGHPLDPSSFDHHYWNTHVEIAKRRQGVRRWSVTMLEPGPNGEPPAYHCLADMDFERREDLLTMMDSPAGRASRADVAGFATGGVTFCYGNERLIIDDPSGGRG